MTASSGVVSIATENNGFEKHLFYLRNGSKLTLLKPQIYLHKTYVRYLCAQIQGWLNISNHSDDAIFQVVTNRKKDVHKRL